jgi:hypothetical protein
LTIPKAIRYYLAVPELSGINLSYCGTVVAQYFGSAIAPLLYHTRGNDSIVERTTRVCAFCDGTGVIARITEFPFFQNGKWCSCKAGQRVFQRIVELISGIQKKVAQILL